MTDDRSVPRFTQAPLLQPYVPPMTSTANDQNRTQTTVVTPLASGARRRPPLGAVPASASHRDLRDRLLRCNG